MTVSKIANLQPRCVSISIYASFSEFRQQFEISFVTNWVRGDEF